MAKTQLRVVDSEREILSRKEFYPAPSFSPRDGVATIKLVDRDGKAHLLTAYPSNDPKYEDDKSPTLIIEFLSNGHALVTGSKHHEQIGPSPWAPRIERVQMETANKVSENDFSLVAFAAGAFKYTNGWEFKQNGNFDITPQNTKAALKCALSTIQILANKLG